MKKLSTIGKINLIAGTLFVLMGIWLFLVDICQAAFLWRWSLSYLFLLAFPYYCPLRPFKRQMEINVFL